MQTIVQNISNSFGYVKCGEILKSRQSDQDPYILRCIQCQEIYLLLESFLLHFEDECRIASSTKKRIRKTKTVKDDKTEDVIHEVENPAVKLESNNHMQMEDPLIVVKNEVDNDNSIFEDECKIQESGSNDLLENPETNNLFIVSEYHTPDDEEDETSFNTQDDNDSEDKESDETQKSNDVYLQQTFETSIKTKYKNKGKPKLKCSLYRHSENLQESVRTHNEQHMENDIFSTLSGSGYQMNFPTQPTFHPKQSYMETGAYFEQNSKVNNKNTLQSVGDGYYMDYYSQPTDLQGQPNKVSGQLYGKSFKGDIMIDIGNDTFCRKKVLDMTLGSSHKSTHVARKLLEGVFKMETLLICTFTGIAPRAQGRERMSQEVVQLDFKARSAIVEFAVRTGEQRGWVPQNVKLIERAMSQRIGEIKRIKLHK